MLLEDYLQLKNKPYDIGVELFAKLGNNATKLALFKASKNSFNEVKLQKELQAIADKRNTKKQVTEALATRIPEQPTPTKFTNFKDNIPEVLKPIHALAVSSFLEKGILHAKLCASAQHELENFDRKRDYEGERFEIQKAMLVLLATNENCWDKIHYYNEHGKLPPEDDQDEFLIDTKTIRELCNLEKSIPTYISKLANRLDKLEFDSPKYFDCIENRTKFELRLVAIKSAIDQLPVYGKMKEVKC